MSACPKCENYAFELEENTPAGSRYRLLFVQCAACGTVVGVLDFFNIGDVLKHVERMVEGIANRLGSSIR